MNELLTIAQTFLQANQWFFPILVCLLIVSVSMIIYSYNGLLLTCIIMGSVMGTYCFMYIGYHQFLPDWSIIVAAPLFVFYFGLATVHLKWEGNYKKEKN